MKTQKEVTEVIRGLSSGKFFCECPCGCGEEINLKDADLFSVDSLTPRAEQAKATLKGQLREQKNTLKKKKENMTGRAQLTTKSVNLGKILERMAPSLPDFRFSHNDCRSLFDPIDYVIFEGLSESSTVKKIIFTDIKSGNARLHGTQREIKALVQDKKVEFKTY